MIAQIFVLVGTERYFCLKGEWKVIIWRGYLNVNEVCMYIRQYNIKILITTVQYLLFIVLQSPPINCM